MPILVSIALVIAEICAFIQTDMPQSSRLVIRSTNIRIFLNALHSKMQCIQNGPSFCRVEEFITSKSKSVNSEIHQQSN